MVKHSTAVETENVVYSVKRSSLELIFISGQFESATGAVIGKFGTESATQIACTLLFVIVVEIVNFLLKRLSVTG